MSSLDDRIQYWMMQAEMGAIPPEKDFDQKNPRYYQPDPQKTLKQLQDLQTELEKRMEEDQNFYAAKKETDQKLLLILKKSTKQMCKKNSRKNPRIKCKQHRKQHLLRLSFDS